MERPVHIITTDDSGASARRALSGPERALLRDHVQGNLCEPLLVAELAALVGLDRYRFHRAFRRAFGVPPYRYVLACRVAEACRLIEAGTMPLCEITYEVGFSSQSHMTTVFKRLTGRTPGRYRAERGGSPANRDGGSRNGVARPG
ncbi:helix-turn-helix domain-containing protein [Spiribacter halobius]|nr:AraC family transcriptional regulator [Spiribacter halobius]UEX79579.1 AraC family transcriptional regulator [Spiribacter halobius]